MIIDMFKMHDADGNGTISKQELMTIFGTLSEWTEEEFEELFKLADTNKDGELQYEEFVTWLMPSADQNGYHGKLAIPLMMATQLLLEFKEFIEAADTDGDGCLDAQEVLAFLHSRAEGTLDPGLENTKKFLEDMEKNGEKKLDVVKLMQFLELQGTPIFEYLDRKAK